DAGEAGRQLLIHGPGHGVACGGTVEDEGRHAVGGAVAHTALVGLCRRAGHAAKAPAARSDSISSGFTPSSARICSLCSPSSGGCIRTCCGVAESFTGKPILGTLPSIGWGMSRRIWRCVAWALSNASG